MEEDRLFLFKDFIGNIKNKIITIIEPDPNVQANKMVITNDPKTWGMCCSKEAAIVCEKDFKEKH